MSSSVDWPGKATKDFFYSSYEKSAEGSELSAINMNHKLYYHNKLGTPQQDDQLIFGGDTQPRRYVGASVTEDARYLSISAAMSTSGNELYLKDLGKADSKIVQMVDNFEQNHQVIHNEGSELYIPH